MSPRKNKPEALEDEVEKAFSCFEARDLLGAARHIDEIYTRHAEFDETDLELLSKIHWLKAQLCCENRDYDEGGSALYRALKIQEKISGRTSVEFISLLRELATLHFSGSGNYVLARQYFEEGEALCYELLRDNQEQHLLALEALSDIACTLGDLFDEIDEQDRSARQFLGQVVYFKKYGNKMEAFLLRPYLRLAQLAAQKGHASEVESCLGEAFALLDASQATLLFYEALCVAADSYRKSGDLEEAELSLRAAKRISDRDSDISESDLFIEFLRVSSLIHLEQSRGISGPEFNESVNQFKQALKSVRAILGKHSATEAAFHFEWALALARCYGQYSAEVEQAFWQALHCVEKSLNPDHPKQLRFLSPYIKYLQQYNKLEQAKAFQERHDEIKNRALGLSQ